jgi:esterase/lipase
MAKILKYIESLSSSSDAEDNEKVGPIAFIILILSKDKDNTYQKLNTKIKESIAEVVTEWSQNIDSIWKELEDLSEYNKDVTLVNTCKAFQLVVNSIKDESVKSNLESFIQKNLKVSEKRIVNFSNFNWS